MAQVQFNLDELKQVKVREKDEQGTVNTHYPYGVDFPDGTKWRQEVELLNIAAPAASWFYSRGNYSTGAGLGAGVTPCSEHTDAVNGYIDTPRWRDQKIRAFVNKPRTYGCPADAFNTWDQLTAIPESEYSKQSCTPDTLEPVVLIRDFTISATKCSGYIQIYNPGERPVRVEILDSSGANVHQHLGISSAYDTADARSTVGFSFNCHPSALFGGEDVTQYPISFTVKCYDLAHYKLNKSSDKTFFDNTAYSKFSSTYLASNTPKVYSVKSPEFTLTQYRGMNSAAPYLDPPNRLIGKLPVELRHVANSADSSTLSVFATIINPFPTDLTLKFYLKGMAPYYNPQQNTSLLQKEITVPGHSGRQMEEIWNAPLEVVGLKSAIDFGLDVYFTDGSYISSTQEIYTSLPREVYPVVMYIGHYYYASGRYAQLHFHNPNDFDVNLYAEIFVDNENVTFTAPTAGVKITANSVYTVPLNFGSVISRIHLSASCYVTGCPYECKASTILTSRTTEFETSLDNIQESPTFQSSDYTNYNATVEVMNENDHEVYCRLHFEYEYTYVYDDQTGETVTRRSESTQIKKLGPGETAEFSYYTQYPSIYQVEVLYDAIFFAPGYMPTGSVGGYLS